MRVVGIKQLKARLSEQVRLAKAGESVLVTERDEVVAELGPARRQTTIGNHHEAVLETLATAGGITRAAQAKGTGPRTARASGCRPAPQTLLEELRPPAVSRHLRAVARDA